MLVQWLAFLDLFTLRISTGIPPNLPEEFSDFPQSLQEILRKYPATGVHKLSKNLGATSKF